MARSVMKEATVALFRLMVGCIRTDDGTDSVLEVLSKFIKEGMGTD